MDLRQELWGDNPIGARRLEALINGLPPGSALHRAVDPDGWGAGWTNQEELLAAICELIDTNNRLFLMANTKKNAKQPRPLHIPRPRDKKPERVKADGESLKALMEEKGMPVIVKGDD